MGRDVTGLRIDKKSNNVAKTNGISNVSVSVAPKIAVERDASEVEDHTANGIVIQDGHEKHDVLGVKSTNLNTSSPDMKSQKDESFKPSDKKLNSPFKRASGSTAAETLQTSAPVRESPSFANEKKNSSSSVAHDAQTVDSGTNSTDKTNDLQSPETKKKTEPISPVSMKIVEPTERKYFDEDDNLSLASSAATSVRTMRSKLTVPVAPTFKCSDRLERRKEYYAKLEEKHKALEVEKLEYAARTQEEEEAAIKQLRKSMMYKANPVPSFYREGPPPKLELKKLPVTRAKSPNLTRRKSCSDASKSGKSSPEEKGSCARAKRHSFGHSREGSNTPATTKTKDVSGGRNMASRASREGSLTPNSTKNKQMQSRQNVNGRSRIKDSPKQDKQTSKPSEISDISVVEEVTKFADDVTDISVTVETTETPCAMPDTLEPDAAIVEEERKGSQRMTSENGIEI